jgi:hypothetical protein
LILLFWVPPPIPRVHDEFSYLLAGDTFAHGRLTNPTHPMWVHFETFHVIQHPTYMSKYPPAQGAFLALGQILGNPWIGVLLSVAGMCAAVLWALQGWVAPRWALVGGFLVFIRFGVCGYWINSYWGGAAAAIGGALVIGALPRLARYLRARDSAILGTGIIILANSRLLEGLVFCVPIAASGLWWLSRRCHHWKTIIQRVVLPLCATVLIGGLFSAYYNCRVTGSPLRFPYGVYEQTYSSIRLLQWQNAAAPIVYRNPQFEAFYNNDGWARARWMKRRITDFKSFVSVLENNLRESFLRLLQVELCIPLLIALTWGHRNRQVRFLFIQTLVCFCGFFLSIWFQPHYAAPLTATMFILVTIGIRYLRKWQAGKPPLGLNLSRALIIIAAVLMPFHKSYGDDVIPQMIRRAEITKALSDAPGEHLIIVRYSPTHDPLEEWVYNDADIDHAKIVWARDIPGISTDPLLSYFHARRVWLVDADTGVIAPYASQPVANELR